MKKRLLAALLLAALTPLLSGCSSLLLERQYVMVQPHDEQYQEDVDSSVLTAENYLGLKNSLLRFVSEGAEYGVIRLYNYTGDVGEDLSSAAFEVTRQDPLGAFAVDYLAHDYVRIVSYYEIHVYITFRCSVEDMERIVWVSGEDGLRSQLEQAMLSGDTAPLIQMSNFADLDVTLDELLSDVYYDNPQLAVYLPSYTLKLYPATGVSQILELSIDYGVSPDELSTRQSDLNYKAKLRSVLSTVEKTDEEKYRLLYNRIIRNTEYDAQAENYAAVSDTVVGGGDSFTAYGALVSGKAAGEGLAMAFKLLCDLAELDCTVVRGRMNGVLHSWNIVNIGGDYYHIDCAVGLLTDEDSGFLLSDGDISADHRWSAESYPACGGPLSERTAGEAVGEPLEENAASEDAESLPEQALTPAE